MEDTALLVTDVQYDFLPPDGSLAIANGRDILPHILSMLDVNAGWDWKSVVATQDYHPRGHISFCTSHKGYEDKPLSVITVQDKEGHDIQQTLWPEHCIQGTKGCEFESNLSTAYTPWKNLHKFHLVQKATDPKLDAYSAFATPGAPSAATASSTSSPLAEYLNGHNIRKIVFCGLATDFCVKATILDALKYGFQCILVQDASRGVSKASSIKAWQELEEKGTKLVQSIVDLKGLLRQ